ncbi:MAG TPA: 30S ribosomal protein S3 [candidate division WOR-3 bacterium]|uniref:Small ribosomal subunit protein uS3 n=1 Tax=candidate division WOR-3 bacterium TaxID=2052148 RepID=A0A7V0T6P1_UNCW3|nr:30S ribosomal protein S3 [candidate division WOR-3 bacterium]
MGQKTHPVGFRVGITRGWKSAWFESRRFREYLHEDLQIRRYIEAKLPEAMVSSIEIKRVANRMTITVFTARPGMVFGTRRANLESLRDEVKRLLKREDVTMHVEVVRVPELDARLVAKNVAKQLEQRIAHRRAMRRAVTQALRLGALGIKVMVGGRLGGHEIARSEWQLQGRVPLHTLKANIDYACETAHTIAGSVGVKVWIYKGDVSAQAARS